MEWKNITQYLTHRHSLLSQVNRFTQCDICVTLRDEKQKTMDKISRNYYDLLYKQHNELQRYKLHTTLSIFCTIFYLPVNIFYNYENHSVHEKIQRNNNFE